MGPTQQNKEPFDVMKEKEIFLDARHDFVDKNKAMTSDKLNERPILEMPQ